MLQTPPQRTIRKQGDWLVCWVLGSAVVADCLAGTPETRWHLEGTSVNLRWKTVADCFLLLKHYSWCVRVCDGVVREGWPQIQRKAIEGGNKRPLALLQSRGWHMPPLLVLHDNHSKYHKFGDAEFAKRPSRVRSFVRPAWGDGSRQVQSVSEQNINKVQCARAFSCCGREVEVQCRNIQINTIPQRENMGPATGFTKWSLVSLVRVQTELRPESTDMKVSKDFLIPWGEK